MMSLSQQRRLLSFVWCLALASVIDAFTLSADSSRGTRRTNSPLFAIRDLQSLYELTDFVNRNEDLTVVCFHAHWCKSCQKVQHYYKKLDASNPLGVQLANVEYSSHASLAKSLGVSKLPTLQFYHQGRKLDEFTCGPKTFGRVLGTIQCLQDELEAQRLLANKLDRGAALVQAAFEQQQQQPYRPSATEPAPASWM